ncbi:MAG: hypothetical protein K2X41_13670 [Hyphomicrobium sp.]|nr:hypothetical protein [Hyphomicrobium sp.]
MKAVVVLLALMVGLPTMAFAHAGHEHGQSVSHAAPGFKASIGFKSLSSAMFTRAQHQKTLAHLSSSTDHSATVRSFVSSSEDIPTARCTPGTCCCHSASSCGSGHCCSFGLPSTQAYGMGQRESKSDRLALTDWPYPDLIFGFDRPPKL